MDRTLKELRTWISQHSSIEQFASDCEVAESTVYAWLNGNRRILQDAAEKIERATRRKFKKERLVFAKRPACTVDTKH